VELGQAEPLGLLDDHDAGVGDVDPHLDNRGGDEHRELAVGEVGHHRVLLRRRHLAVDQAHARSDGALEVDRPLLGRRQIADLALRDQWADPEGLGAGDRDVAQAADHLAHAVHGDGPGRDRRAAGRLLVDAADVEVAVHREFQRSRDRRGRHGQQVRALALGLQPLALGHAEAMLLVDHHQLEALESDVVLEEGVGADRHLHLSGGQRAQLLGPRRALVAPGEQDDADAVGAKRPGDGFVVLAGQDFRGRHQGVLTAGRGHIGHGAHCHHGLA
jgi:hypothetical protein